MAPERKARADWLATLGVPAPFHDAIIDAPSDEGTSIGGPVVAFVVVAVPVAGMAGSIRWLDAFVRARAAAVAAQNGASLAHVDVGLGPLLLLFGLIALMGWIYIPFTAHHRVNGFLSLAAAMINAPPKQGHIRLAMQWILRGSVRRAADSSTTVDQFLRHMTGHQMRRWRLVAIAVLLPAVTITVLETNSFWIAGPAGIVEHLMFPPFSNRRFDLREAKAITTGCTRTNKNRLIYEIRFLSGERFDLSETEPLRGGKVNALEEINSNLSREVEHRRWEPRWGDTDPVHYVCFDVWAKKFLTQDGTDRLAALLRVTTDEFRQLDTQRSQITRDR